MQPNPLKWYDFDHILGFGELNENNRLHGRGIEIWIWGAIEIGYYENNSRTGNGIKIWSDGMFRVGEFYRKDGRRWERGTQYNTDGTEMKYDLMYLF